LVVSAQDDDTPVDPATFEGNWCDEGGKWYDPVEYAPFTSRCEAQPDEWSRAFMWANGWYGALYDAGGISLDELGELEFTILGNIVTINHPNFLLPETPAPVVVGSSQACYVEGGGSFWTSGEYFSSDDCTGALIRTFKVVTADNATDAIAACGVGYVVDQPTTLPAWPSTLWHCFESA
jgi:hypothetical protein